MSTIRGAPSDRNGFYLDPKKCTAQQLEEWLATAALPAYPAVCNFVRHHAIFEEHSEGVLVPSEDKDRASAPALPERVRLGRTIGSAIGRIIGNPNPNRTRAVYAYMAKDAPEVMFRFERLPDDPETAVTDNETDGVSFRWSSVLFSPWIAPNTSFVMIYVRFLFLKKGLKDELAFNLTDSGLPPSKDPARLPWDEIKDLCKRLVASMNFEAKHRGWDLRPAATAAPAGSAPTRRDSAQEVPIRRCVSRKEVHDHADGKSDNLTLTARGSEVTSDDEDDYVVIRSKQTFRRLS